MSVRTYLLAHCTLVRISGRLVVVGVGNQTGHHSQDGQRVDLHVRVGCELEVGGKGGGDTEGGRERGREERGKRKKREK